MLPRAGSAITADSMATLLEKARHPRKKAEAEIKMGMRLRLELWARGQLFQMILGRICVLKMDLVPLLFEIKEVNATTLV